MIPVIEKIDALLTGLTKTDLQHMPPLHRQRLAQALRRVADIADPPVRPEGPRSGVLALLHDGVSRD